MLQPQPVGRIGPTTVLAPLLRRQYRPVVFSGLLDGYRYATLDELAEGWGQHVVPVIPISGGAAYAEAGGVDYQHLPLADVVAQLDASGGMVSARPGDWLPGVEARLPTLEPGPQARWRRARIWVSPARTVTPLHHEMTDNLLAQLEGRKQVTLYAPWQRRAMYPRPIWSRMPHTSRVRADAPDATRFPRFARARPWRAELEPGDVLYIPKFWWHWVWTHERSLSYNLWFAGGAVAAAARGMEWYQRLRSLSV